MTTDEVLIGLSGLAMLPVFVVAIILLTRWQDAREDRRRAAKQATPHRS